MTLVELRDRLSVAQIGIACAAVAFGGGVAWTSLLVAGILAVWAFVRPLPAEPSPRAQRLWTAGIAVALLLTGARALLWADFLDAGVDFLLLLVVQRLFNRQRAREHAQLLALGALLMVVGAVINTGLNYPILFGAYLLVAIMTLVTNHLLSEGERLGPRIAADVQREARRSARTLWRASAQVAALAAVGGLLVFLFFPRWGVGVFLRGAMARDARSGFSGEVRLGLFGTIKTDATVAARIVPMNMDERPRRLLWHLRGSSFEVYEHGRWRSGADGEAVPLVERGGWAILAPEGNPEAHRAPGTMGRHLQLVARPIPGFDRSTETLHAQVTLEDLGVDVLFAASKPLAIKLRPRGAVERRLRVLGGLNRVLRIDKPPGPIQYEFLSRIGEPTPEELRAVGDPAVPIELAGFTLRSESLSSDVTELAVALTRDAPTRYDKVDAVMRHLSTFRYTLDLESSPRVDAGADPLEGFLFDTRAGHCEYFATALAVLLREVGVPTRIVNGYYGAHYNQLGEYYAVRQADAHSWVEVHFGELGWVTFDPTPPSGRTAGDDAPLWPAASAVLDALRSAYLEWVIDYDLGKQLAVLEQAGLRRNEGPRGRIDWRGASTWLAALAGVFVAWRAARRRGRPRPPFEVRLWTALLRRLAARGHRPQPGESPTRFARRIAARTHGGGDALLRFATRYEALRFGPGASSADLAELRRLAAACRRALGRGAW